jgi:putative endonuclease
MQNTYYVYILASKRNGTLYIGVTNNLERRIFEHKQGTFKGFTERHNVHLLVYYEWFNDIENAIRREKQLKKWNRDWKLNLIEKRNPEWVDLSENGYQFPIPEPVRRGGPATRESRPSTSH